MQNAPLKQARIQWLVDPDVRWDALGSEPNPNHLHLQCPYPPGIGQGWIDRLSLSPEMAVYHSVHHFTRDGPHQLLPLGEFHLEFSQACLCILVMHSGCAVSRELQPPRELQLKPGRDLFRHGVHGHFMPLVHTGEDIEMTALVLTDAALCALVGEVAASQLLADLHLDLPSVVQLQSIPLFVSEPLRQCLGSGCSGALHTLYAHSKVLEYLWRLARHAGGGLPRRGASHESDTLAALHDYLLQLEGQLPTLKELSRMFGMSPQTLNRGFVRTYGHSIYALVTSHRLGQAHSALLESKLPIKSIATRLGYSHVNHFNHGFRKKFGYTPGSLRRKS